MAVAVTRRAKAAETWTGAGLSLEVAQRSWGRIDLLAKMSFSAGTVADMIEDIALELDENRARHLQAVVNALRGCDAHHKLELKGKKKGGFVSTAEESERFQKGSLYRAFVQAYLRAHGGLKKVPVSLLAEIEGISRTTVYETIALIEKAEAARPAYLQALIDAGRPASEI